jgi:hypothetical protein
MSHTDKDEPYWVTRAVSDLVKHNHTAGECRIETLRDIQVQHWSWRSDPPCKREHPLDGPWIWYGGNPPREFVRQYWHKPERARERNILADLRQWRREDLEDFDYEHRQARGSALNWWRW